MTAVLVTGATGPYKILAVTRDVNSPSSQRLLEQSSNIQLVEGNLDNPHEIFRNAKKADSTPIWGVLSVQTANRNSTSEETQSKALIDESVKNGVKYFIYSSVDCGGEASINSPTRKWNWTILRPTAFFENFVPGFFGKPLQLVSTSDIGYFGALAFPDPERYKSRAIFLAGDELTFGEMARIYRRKTGNAIPTTFSLPCHIFMASMKDMGYMFKWFHDEGYKADIEDLRRIHPKLKDFSSWLETESPHMQR
ncbi:nucleoside-diphosphate-sugar epimerase family protein [Aspergillus alliaceus]|uniref:nucleoside-diphosphate-sugar epimerase family protein n=1 Tax=Petromyces alliaceus TaxID=209559 RepID=UPI0012A479C7|nr:nucleoside-diphosphate-sugar epimerase family protein [Aspergillus alliaceus]KAB8231679.1 nucleoside-diphosphate-sugar epimerase family protein [Aspergillus alliaceus]